MFFLLLACSGSVDRSAQDSSSDDSACSSDNGTLHACVYMFEGDETGVANAHVGFRAPGEEAWTDALTGADGCVDIGLAAGAWEARGDDSTQTCATPAQEVTISECTVSQRRFDVGNWCMDG